MTYVTARGGRLYRPGFSTDSSKVSLGDVETVLAGNSSQFRIDRVNQYKLQRTADGESFLCNVYFEQQPVASAKVQRAKLRTSAIISDRMTGIRLT